MNDKCNDSVFGEMIYKHRWFKSEKIKMFNAEWNITIAAKAYSGKPITVEQQNSYKSYKENEEKNLQRITTKVAKYIDVFSDELNGVGVSILSNKDLGKVVVPKTLLFEQDGTAIMLFDFVLDVEHGIGINLDTLEIGSQDLFL